jgi:uncharacterized protein (TIGR00255 family)
MRSMTAYAEVTVPLTQGHLRLSLRSVNHKSLDLSIRLHPALYPLEAALRAEVRGAAQRGKLDLSVEVHDEPGLEPQLNRSLLKSVAKAWQEDAEWLYLPPLSPEAFFRLPQAWLPSAPDLAERLETPLLEALRNLVERWNEGRNKEAERLRPFFEEGLATLRRIRSDLEREAAAHALELPEQYRQKLEQLLRDAQVQGQVPAERLLAEAGVLTERQDVREELVRLAAHLEDFGERLAKGKLAGKGLDVWCQEVLREINTIGSKCKRLAMTRLVMEAKQALEQIREQGANLE